MIIEKLLILMVAFALLAPVGIAESLGPEDLVRMLVRGAHENKLQWVIDSADLVKIARDPRHGRSPENLVELLKGIEQDKITFEVINRVGWPNG